MKTQKDIYKNPYIWWSRIVLTLVFAWNVLCAIDFIFTPDNFIGSYELAGISGKIAIQGLGIAFLMWNVTYPMAIMNPVKYIVLYRIILIQQLIGLIGETILLFSLDAEHYILIGSLQRFVLFDSVGFILMLTTYLLVEVRRYHGRSQITVENK